MPFKLGGARSLSVPAVDEVGGSAETDRQQQGTARERVSPSFRLSTTTQAWIGRRSGRRKEP